MMISIGILVGLGASAFIVWYIHDRIRFAERNRQLSKLKTLSVPWFPLVGQAWYFIGSTQKNIRLAYEVLAKSTAPLVIWFGPIPSVHLTKIEDIEYVSKVCSDRRSYGFLEDTIGAGMVTQNHENWRTTRRLLNPAFGSGVLVQCLGIFDEQSRRLADLLEPKAIEGESFDLWPFLLDANVSTVSQYTMDIRPGSKKSPANEYAEAFTNVVLSSAIRLLNPLLYPDVVFKVYSQLTGLNDQMKTVLEYSKKPVKEALKNMNKERTASSSERNTSKKMIDLLLGYHQKNPSYMTEKQMVNELNHMTMVGNEAMAIASGFLLMMYGMYQDEQEMVYQEIKSVIPDDRPTTIEDLNQLVYMEQTIKETLRLFNVLPATYRSLEHNLTLPGGETIPDHVEVLLHLNTPHENPSYYPNPSKWNPANFSPEAISARPPNSFIPFGLGPRACMGPKYAMWLMKVQMCHVLRKYRLSTDTKLEEIVFVQDIFRRSRDGYLVRLCSRDQ